MRPAEHLAKPKVEDSFEDYATSQNNPLNPPPAKSAAKSPPNPNLQRISQAGRQAISISYSVDEIKRAFTETFHGTDDNALQSYFESLENRDFKELLHMIHLMANECSPECAGFDQAADEIYLMSKKIESNSSGKIKEVLFQLSNTYLSLKYTNAAIFALKVFLKFNPNNNEAKHRLGFAYFQNKDYATAQKILEESKKSKGQDAWTILGTIYSYQGKYDTAIQACHEYFAGKTLGKNDFETLIIMTDCYMMMEKYELALTYAKKAQSLKSSHDPCVLGMFSALYYRMGKYELSLSFSLALMETQSDNASANLNMGSSYSKLNKHKKAVKYLKAGLEQMKSMKPIVHQARIQKNIKDNALNLMISLSLLGNFDEAYSTFIQYLYNNNASERPEEVSKEECLRLEEFAKLLFQNHNNIGAIDAYNRILQLDPGNTRILYYRALLCCSERDPNFQRLALEDYEALLKQNPNDVKVLYERGVFFLSNKKRSRSFGRFDKSPGIGPRKQKNPNTSRDCTH